ncbi:MAG: hypothetical protein ABI721_04535 [Candidatus Dojkabacteria bacterium]
MQAQEKVVEDLSIPNKFFSGTGPTFQYIDRFKTGDHTLTIATIQQTNVSTEAKDYFNAIFDETVTKSVKSYHWL